MLRKFKVTFCGEHAGETYLIFFNDPECEAGCSISLWYGKTGRMTALYRHGVSLTRSLTREQRTKLNDVVATTVSAWALMGDDPELWVELPL